jgi:hypothetical protein
VAGDEANTCQVPMGYEPSWPGGRGEGEVEWRHVFLGQLVLGRSRTRSARAPITARYRTSDSNQCWQVSQQRAICLPKRTHLPRSARTHAQERTSCPAASSSIFHWDVGAQECQLLGHDLVEERFHVGVEVPAVVDVDG